MISVVHVIDGLSERDGGPSYSVPALAGAQGGAGAAVTLRTVADTNPARTPPSGIAHVIHQPTKGALGAMLRASSDMRLALEADAQAGAILHAHCLWLMPNLYPAWARRGAESGAKLIHSTRGMLSPEALAISRWKKWPFWLLLQRRALELADCLHATAISEYEEIRAQGLGNPVAIIPNAIDLPDCSEPRAQGPERILLSLGRLHPKKGLDRLVRAWAELEHAHPAWRLRIIGPSERGYDGELRQLATSLGLDHVSIEPSITGAAKLAAYRSADAFVLPTLNENFALTVAEALAAEVPVIATKGAPWSGLESERCGWWIDHGTEPLTRALSQVMQMPRSELMTMGANGRSWMERDFSWDRIAADMLDVYRWLKLGGEPPSTLRLS